ncbi:PREDICTED: non-specific lipid-transfer protein-like protein At5g64080 [Populus euphratica]|uniref:Non-specific lipid-transfer protein-like protein At5g64080 n=1 Tax=Populus euphratica TaxID=75702 RepID=A0AAJ6XQM2_POPEU|nr:PREDICTED: non-specific lipid-transfer protein-like protein At5g64080 [Populus euphratica]
MKTTLFITCIVATLAVLAKSAQHGSPPESPAPAPSVDCSDVAFDMLDCVTYLSDGNAEKPTDSCCAGFEAVLSLDDECLCFALKHSADFGVAVNLTRAAALSSECGVSAPPLSKCGANTPSSAPEPAAPTPVIEPPTNDQPSAPAAAPSNSSDDDGRSAAAPVTSDVPAQAPAKGTAYAVSAPSLVLISSAVASALSLFLWI